MHQLQGRPMRPTLILRNGRNGTARRGSLPASGNGRKKWPKSSPDISTPAKRIAASLRKREEEVAKELSG